MTGRKRILLIAGGAILLLIIVVANLKRSAGGTMAVQAGNVRKGTVTATVRAPGRVQPETQVKLSANVPGEVRQLPIHEGDPVRKGQFLLQLDDAQFRAQVNEATAAIAAARSNLKLAEASLAHSESILNRKEALSKQNLVSAEELDQARTDASADRARVDAGKEEIQRLTATLQAAHDNLRKTRFISPIDGTVTQLTIERGEIAVIGTMNNPGTVLLTVADLSKMKVEADVDETDVATVRLGQEATVKVDALPDTTLIGHVTQIANSPIISGLETQEQETNFKVDVTIDHPPITLRPGMTADVEIRTAREDSVLAVPIQSVVIRTPEDLKPPEKGKKKGGAQAEPSPTSGERPKQEEIRGVFVIANGKAEFRKVKTGIASDTDFEVTGELKPGEKVVIGPHKTLRALKPGQRVKIEEPKKAKGKEPA